MSFNLSAWALQNRQIVLYLMILLGAVGALSYSKLGPVAYTHLRTAQHRMREGGGQLSVSCAVGGRCVSWTAFSAPYSAVSCKYEIGPTRRIQTFAYQF